MRFNLNSIPIFNGSMVLKCRNSNEKKFEKNPSIEIVYLARIYFVENNFNFIFKPNWCSNPCAK